MQDGLTNDYQAAKHAHDEVVDLVHRFKADEVDNTDHVTILERASPAVEDLQEWMDLIGRGSHYGALVGFILSLINAAVIHRFSGTSELPPLTASPSIP